MNKSNDMVPLIFIIGVDASVKGLRNARIAVIRFYTYVRKCQLAPPVPITAYFGRINFSLKSLNSYFDCDCNKLINLEIAKSLGFRIPDSIVTNNIEEIKSFLQIHKEVLWHCRPV